MTMSPTQDPFKHVVAFEVSKTSLVVHSLPADEQCVIANTQQAVRRLLRAEGKRNAKANLGPMLIVAEASGGYERCVLDAALDLGLACHRAHGSRVRFFARYLGLIAKTDRIDARVLAAYGLKTERLRLFEPLKPEEQALKELQGRRDEIQQMLIAENNRLEHARLACVVRSIKTHIAGLRKALDALEAEIAALIDANESLARKARLMRTVIGVGPVTAATLLANMPELGSLTKGEAARLAGLAPINRDSGKLSAPRHIVAGRSAVRRCLYMAALVALNRNPVLKAFASGLRARGKPFKVVITAVMRKLIVILNAIVRDGEPWTHARPA
jgi:transposase